VYICPKVSCRFISFAFGVSLAAADNLHRQPKLSAAEIVNKNVEDEAGCRHGAAVQTMTDVGQYGRGGNRRATLAVPHTTGRKLTLGLPAPRPEKEMELPFVMELARPHKQRFELKFNGRKRRSKCMTAPTAGS